MRPEGAHAGRGFLEPSRDWLGMNRFLRLPWHKSFLGKWHCTSLLFGRHAFRWRDLWFWTFLINVSALNDMTRLRDGAHVSFESQWVGSVPSDMAHETTKLTDPTRAKVSRPTPNVSTLHVPDVCSYELLLLLRRLRLCCTGRMDEEIALGAFQSFWKIRSLEVILWRTCSVCNIVRL